MQVYGTRNVYKTTLDGGTERKASDLTNKRSRYVDRRKKEDAKGKRETGKESETRGVLERSKLNRYISVLRGQREKVRVVEVGYISE